MTQVIHIFASTGMCMLCEAPWNVALSKDLVLDMKDWISDGAKTEIEELEVCNIPAAVILSIIES